MSRIGYNYLSISEKKVYEQFEKAFMNYASMIDISSTDKNVDIMKVLQVVLGDNPQIIYFNKTQIKRKYSLFNEKVCFYDMASMTRIKSMNKELEEVLQKAVEEIGFQNPITNYDKLICIYEYLQDHVTYDAKELEACSRTGKSINYISHNAYGALVKKKAVCDGISSAFALISQKLGFDCFVVTGQANFRTLQFSEHAWNVIKIGDFFYHIDATWDINHKEQMGGYFYDYFCVNDDSICRDHEWDINMTPACVREDFSYYRRNSCYANNLSQLEEIFIRYVKSKQKIVRVKIADGIAIPEPEDSYLGKKLISIATSMRGDVNVRFMWNREMRCFYSKFGT